MGANYRLFLRPYDMERRPGIYDDGDVLTVVMDRRHEQIVDLGRWGHEWEVPPPDEWPASLPDSVKIQHFGDRYKMLDALYRNRPEWLTAREVMDEAGLRYESARRQGLPEMTSLGYLDSTSHKSPRYVLSHPDALNYIDTYRTEIVVSICETLRAAGQPLLMDEIFEQIDRPRESIRTRVQKMVRRGTVERIQPEQKFRIRASWLADYMAAWMKMPDFK